MRIVLDTNVVVSSLWGGPPKRIMEACFACRVKLLISRPILDEYFSVLSRFDLQDEDADILEALFADRKRTEMLAPEVHIRAIAADPSDNKFLECAVEGRAEYLVSGDKHLLGLKLFRGIPILAPRAFLRRI